MQRPRAHIAQAPTTGGTPLARAKRTDRTEARRRYRAEQADAVELEGGDEGEYPSGNAAEPTRRKGTAPESSKSAAPAKAAPMPQRPSFTDSAKRAYRPPRIREDLPHLPRLLIHWSVLLSAGLAILGTVLLVSQGTTSTSTGSTSATTLGYIGGMMFSLFVGLPPFGAALLMGFMLPRATYLIGLIYGVFAYVLLLALYMTQPAITGSANIGLDYYLSALGLMVVGTMFFTSGIAWYRRFLDLLNPARAQRQQAAKKAQAQGRGNAPRNRLSGPTR